MIRIIESVNDEKTITLKVNDPDKQLSKLLNDIKTTAQSGHTFNVVVDPDDEEPRAYEIDGDGACHINDISESKADSKKESLQLSNELSEALDDMYKAMEQVLNLWDEGPEGFNRECLDNKDYPFDKSFDELLLEVNKWISTARRIELSGVE